MGEGQVLTGIEVLRNPMNLLVEDCCSHAGQQPDLT